MKIIVRSTGTAVAVLAFAATAAGAQATRAPAGLPLKHAPRPTTPAITAADAMTRVYVLADDSMMGREAGTAGNVKGTDYIAREARRIGLEPAGDNGTFFQTIPLVTRAPDAASALTVDGQALALGTDFVPLPTVDGVFSFAERLTASNTPVVYGGKLGEPNLISPEQAAGKLVVFAAPAADAQGRAWRFWAGGTFERYAGAAGVAFATLDATPENIRGFFTSPQTELQAQPAANAPKAPAGILVTTAAAEKLLGRPLAGATVGTAGKTVSGAAAFSAGPTPFPARNVVGILRGTDPRLRNQYVAVGAHNDHEGVTRDALDHDSLRAFNLVLRRGGVEGEPDPVTPEAQARIRQIADSLRALRPARRDSVFNGADDDGSGTAGVLEIAEYLAAHRPRRSVLFVWHTAEEKGLLGSEWFTDHPTVPRDSIVAQLNMDMIGRGAAGDETGADKEGKALHGGANYVQLVGSRRLSTQLGDIVEEVNRTRNHGLSFDYSIDANGHPANIYCRSDHYNYARYGIPVTFFTTGGHADYHMLTDEPQYIDYDKLAHVAALVADVAKAVGDRGERLVVDKPKPDPHGSCQQ